MQLREFGRYELLDDPRDHAGSAPVLIGGKLVESLNRLCIHAREHIGVSDLSVRGLPWSLWHCGQHLIHRLVFQDHLHRKPVASRSYTRRSTYLARKINLPG